MLQLLLQLAPRAQESEDYKILYDVGLQIIYDTLRDKKISELVASDFFPILIIDAMYSDYREAKTAVVDAALDAYNAIKREKKNEALDTEKSRSKNRRTARRRKVRT